MKPRFSIAVLALILTGAAATVLRAGAPAAPRQPAPAYATLDQRSLNQTTILLNAQQGLFALREGVLARLDPATMEPIGIVQLFGPPPELPKTGPATAEAANEAVFERARRMMPAAMFESEHSLLILIGDRFFRVDAATLEIKVNVSVAEGESANTIERLRTLLQEKQALTQVGDTLYVLRGKKLFSVNGADGKVAAAQELPGVMAQRFYPDNMELKARQKP